MTVTEIAAALGLVGMIAGGVWAMDARHASQEDFQELAGSYQQFSLEQKLWSYRQRLWYLQEKLGPNCGVAAQECRWLREEITRLERRLRR